MPGITEHFGIRYPCPGDTVTMEAFSNWAYDIDEALTTVNELSIDALNRPRAMLRTATTGFPVNVGVQTQVLFTTEVYNNGLSNLSMSGFSRGVQPEGLYMFMAQVTPIGSGTTVTSYQARIFAEGTTTIAGRTLASSVATTTAKPISLIGLGFLTSLGGASLQVQWTGTGGPLLYYCQFSCAYVAPATP